ncbi:hypothetical protein [Microbacterium lacticum]
MTDADASTSLQRTYRYLRLAIVGAVVVVFTAATVVPLIVIVVVRMPLYGSLHVGHVFGVFVGEVLALLLFAAFWVLQSVQHWRVDDPAIRAQV